jgi:hypothetical protein
MSAYLASDGGDSCAIAIVTNARDGAAHEIFGAFVVWGAEVQAIQEGDGTSSHGKDVPQDAADSGCGPLERFYRSRAIVGLDLERYLQGGG